VEDQRDQQSAYSAVPIEERMDGFELYMGQGGHDQGRLLLTGVQEVFQFADALGQDIRWRWNEVRICGARAANPVLGTAEFPRLFVGGPSALKQLSMNLSKQTSGERHAFA
jgi:hypothetical protein